MSSIRFRITGHARDIGFPVRRLLPAAQVRTVGPFVFFDHMGPALFAGHGTAGDVRPHPHIGLATVTYLFSGAMMHRDSLGNVQRITPGDVNWMSAGRGIVHSERVPEDIRAQGTAVQGLQMWVGLPRAVEQMAPAFWHYAAASLPSVELQGASAHVLVGQAFGVSSPVLTHSRTLYVAVRLAAGAHVDVAADESERAVYVADGAVQADSAESVAAGTLAVLEPGVTVRVTALQDSLVMLLGGDALDGQRFVWWNFVASRPELIEAAKTAWVEQRPDVFPPIDHESEFIPLPLR